MEGKYFELKGEVVELNSLTIPKAKECAGLIVSSDFSFFTIVECQKLNGNEIIIFDVDVQRKQEPVYDIRYVERIAVDFDQNDNRAPWVYALRSDFPQVPHLNLREFEVPKCLCLYEESYDEIKIQWSGSQFLETIREWLKHTAHGNLHQEDQPLEPLIIGSSGIIIFPVGALQASELVIRKVNEVNGKLILHAKPKQDARETDRSYSLLILNGEAQEHGIIRRAPKNFKDLQELLSVAKIDLFEEVKNWIGTKHLDNRYLNRKLVIFLILPKKRKLQNEDTGYDLHAVLTEDTLWHLGKKLGLTKKKKSFKPFRAPELSACELKLLLPHIEFNPENAAQLNDAESVFSKRIYLIGAGALGSQVYSNMVRSGFCNWIIVDDDILLPHNLARHSLSNYHVGFSKAESLAKFGNTLLNTNSIKPFTENFLHPAEQVVLLDAVEKADLILDISASIPVARELMDVKNAKAKRVSAFLNPMGSDLIILAEDLKRTQTLDVIEMQYYRHLLNSPDLHNHLKMDKIGIRYSNSCRSVSSRIPQDYLGVHSGITSRMLKKLVESAESFAGIWSIDPESLEVNRHEIPLYNVKKIIVNGWCILIDEFLIYKIFTARRKKLPKETGGILIGSYDMVRRKIYLVDTILSPKDSEEYPHAYIRGIDGIEEELGKIKKVTAGNLDYVGEWHSHPEKCAIEPSKDDKFLFSWLSNHMGLISRPPLMLIAGDNDAFNLFVEEI